MSARIPSIAVLSRCPCSRPTCCSASHATQFRRNRLNPFHGWKRKVNVLTLAMTCVSMVGCGTQPPKENKVLDAFKREIPEMDALATRAREALRQTGSIELFFLVPDETYSPPQKEPDKQYFDWWKITGRTVLSEADRKTVAERLDSDIETNRRIAEALG